MELLVQDTAALALSDAESQEITAVFENTHVENAGEKLAKMVCYSQRKASAKVIFGIFSANPQRFLKTLQSLGDSHGTIIVNVLRETGNDTEHWISRVLHQIKTHLQHSNLEDALVRFYCLVYLGLISEFSVVSPADLPVVLSQLRTGLELANAAICFIVVKSIELNQSDSYEAINGFFDYTLETCSDNHSIMVLLLSLSHLFAICPLVCARVYISNACRDIITEQVKKISPLALQLPHISTLTDTLLMLVSSSCIDDECRKFTAANYLDLLKAGCGLDIHLHPKDKVLSVLCVVKLWNFLLLDANSGFQYSIDDLLKILVDYVVNRAKYGEQYVEYAIEALAYLTLNVSYKKALRADQLAIDELLSIAASKTQLKTPEIASSHSPVVYGLLLIFGNLMQIKEEAGQSQERKTVNYLKLVATPSSKPDSKEDVTPIHSFNKSLLIDHKFLSLMTKLKVIKNSTNNSLDQLIRIIFYISTNQDKQVRTELVKQGASSIILDYIFLDTKPPEKLTEDEIHTRFQAIRALAKMLVLVNPSLVFNKHKILDCIPSLVQLLGPSSQSQLGQKPANLLTSYLRESITVLDKFEGLLALTNISSISDESGDIKDSIIKRTFDQYLENLIIETEQPRLQMAAWELISNLILRPMMLVKFFNTEEQQSMKRLDILFKMLELTDVQLQITLAGLLANATSEFDMIPQLLVEKELLRDELVSVLVRTFNSQYGENDLILRLVYILLDLVYAAANVNESCLDYFKDNKDLKGAVTVLIKQNKNQEVLQVVMEVIKLVKFN